VTELQVNLFVIQSFSPRAI